MSAGSKIEWTEATWNPIAGCTPVSPGCLNCYAATMSARLEAMGQEKYKGLTVLNNGRRIFNGKISFDEVALTSPLARHKPTTYFVNSMSDLFHEDVPFDYVDKVFAVMALCPHHTFQVLTKRPERMAEYFADPVMCSSSVMGATSFMWWQHHKKHFPISESSKIGWPLRNVWLGTSVENQKAANERIRHLIKCPAAVRFLSVEPMLGPVDLFDVDGETSKAMQGDDPGTSLYPCDMIDWVIAGGKSGPKARPMHPDWVRSIRNQCTAAAIPFFFKQWGAWYPVDQPWKQDAPKRLAENETWWNVAGGSGFHGEEVWRMRKVGKSFAGRMLDGREWDEMPNRGGAV